MSVARCLRVTGKLGLRVSFVWSERRAVGHRRQGLQVAVPQRVVVQVDAEVLRGSGPPNEGWRLRSSFPAPPPHPSSSNIRDSIKLIFFTAGQHTHKNSEFFAVLESNSWKKNSSSSAQEKNAKIVQKSQGAKSLGR